MKTNQALWVLLCLAPLSGCASAGDDGPYDPVLDSLDGHARARSTFSLQPDASLIAMRATGRSGVHRTLTMRVQGGEFAVVFRRQGPPVLEGFQVNFAALDLPSDWFPPRGAEVTNIQTHLLAPVSVRFDPDGVGTVEAKLEIRWAAAFGARTTPLAPMQVDVRGTLLIAKDFDGQRTATLLVRQSGSFWQWTGVALGDLRAELVGVERNRALDEREAIPANCQIKS